MRQNDLILVIDLQNVYQPGQPWGCPSFPRSLENVKTLLDTVGALATPPQVFLTQFVEDPQAGGMWAEYNRLNHDINAEPWMSELVAPLAHYAGQYPVCQKSTYSSMPIPELQQAAQGLLAQGEEDDQAPGRVVLTGVVAECCVLATAIEAIDMGCHVVYLRDACSGVSEETEQAVLKVLEGLSPPHVTIMTTAEYLGEKV